MESSQDEKTRVKLSGEELSQIKGCRIKAVRVESGWVDGS